MFCTENKIQSEKDLRLIKWLVFFVFIGFLPKTCQKYDAYTEKY